MSNVLSKAVSFMAFYFFIYPYKVLSLFKKNKLTDSTQTYFPELDRKSKLQIICDQMRHLRKWKHFEQFYFLYGFDVKGLRNQSDYLDYTDFMHRRDYLNNHPHKEEIYSYTGILRDKFFFSIFMENFGFPIPRTLGLIDKKQLQLQRSGEIRPIDDILNYEGNYMCKPLDGIGGIGIFSLELVKEKIILDGAEVSVGDLKAKMADGRFFVQERIMEQHPLMASLYEKSINTLRITTVRDLCSGNIEIMGCMLLMGAREAIVSNWHYGGVIINVNMDGSLDKYGFSLYEKKITSHPETGVVFETFKVPFFEQAVEQAAKCHKMFYGIHSIGWDFAVLPDGVMFIEGNDNWGMAAHQMVGGGLAAKFKKYYFK